MLPVFGVEGKYPHPRANAQEYRDDKANGHARSHDIQDHENEESKAQGPDEQVNVTADEALKLPGLVDAPVEVIRSHKGSLFAAAHAALTEEGTDNRTHDHEENHGAKPRHRRFLRVLVAPVPLGIHLDGTDKPHHGPDDIEQLLQGGQVRGYFGGSGFNTGYTVLAISNVGIYKQGESGSGREKMFGFHKTENVVI